METSDGGMTAWRARGLALLAGLLVACAFPPVNAWPLALFGWAPLFVALRGAGELGTRKRVWRGFRLGWLAGLVQFTGTLWWIGHVSAPGMLALCAYLALYPAAAAMAAAALSRPGTSGGRAWAHGLLVAGVWTGLEWVRSVALSGFPWNGPAAPLIALRSWSQLAGITGVHGLAWLPLLTSWTVALFLTGSRAARVVSAAGLGVVTLVTGLTEWGLRAAREKADALAGERPLALLVQPAVTMEEKMFGSPEVQRRRYRDLISLTDAALEAHPDARLVVWPESAIPGFFDEPGHGPVFDHFLTPGGFTLITGTDSEDWGLHNSLAAMHGGAANFALHGKVRLVPFGEFIPFRKEIPVLESMLGDLIPLDFAAGTSLEPLKVDPAAPGVIPLVCFEDTIGDHARKFVRPEPQLMVNITNDNWFHRSPATEMHFLNARWRAIELRRPLLRSANTGVTAVVETDGRVSARLPSFEAGVLAARYPAKAATVTFYARHGELVSQVIGGVSWLVLGGLLLARRRSGRKP